MIILFGPSASGKTEIAKRLMSKYGLKKVVTCTTREPRIGEVNDIDYHFLTKDKFDELLKKNEFVETAFYNNNYYGSLKKEVDDDKIVVIEPNGVKEYLKLNNPSIVTFFTSCPEDIRKQRMEGRLDKAELIIQRLNNDKIDFREDVIPSPDFIIDTSKKTVEELVDEVFTLYTHKLNKTKEE